MFRAVRRDGESRRRRKSNTWRPPPRAVGRRKKRSSHPGQRRSGSLPGPLLARDTTRLRSHPRGGEEAMKKERAREAEIAGRLN